MKSAFAVILLATSVLGIPSSLLEDVKIAKSTPARSHSTFLPNKVKRSQEEFTFGDQQNQPFIDMESYQREMRFPGASKTDLANFYSAFPDQRMKRAPLKRRSLSRIRSKRDSDIDPRELLPVLLLALSEEKLGMLNKNRDLWKNYGLDVSDSDWPDNVEATNQLPELDDKNNGEWLDAPVIPSAHRLDEPSSRHWGFKDADHKRFMVSKRYQNPDNSAIAQLFANNQPWDYNIPVYRRAVL